MKMHEFRAAILDTDGVITKTAKVHAHAWKAMFDEYLEGRANDQGEPQDPFDIRTDYREYLDGKPRYDGVKSFLQSRGIELPWGEPDDAGDVETVCGLGNRKNAYFLKALETDGVEPYEDTVAQIENWKRDGWKVAVISSSRNCEAILRKADLLKLFDAKIDGNDAQRMGIQGKPAPDVFLEAAKMIGVDPAQAIVVEDAISGVQSGKAGNFGMVAGVDREDDAQDLWDAGADVVVRDLRELQIAKHCPPDENCLRRPCSALSHAGWLATHVKASELALFLDYDGTLTPIARRPEEAILADETRDLLGRLAERFTVAIVSGRDLRDVQNMVKVDNLVYAGSHGYDIEGPGGMVMRHEEAKAAVPQLDAAEQTLTQAADKIEGAHLERKRFGLAVHYREVESDADVDKLAAAVDEVDTRHTGLRKLLGKKVFELQPNVEWNKGFAVTWLAEALGYKRPEASIMYVGDDVTDEDAFRALRYQGLGIGIRVGDAAASTHATYYVKDCPEVTRFLQLLLDSLQG